MSLNLSIITCSLTAELCVVVEHALVANGITSLRIDSRIAKGNPALVFAKSPDIQVLLLHGYVCSALIGQLE
jgi:E3 ubiquitin-protein ligase SHPRH